MGAIRDPQEVNKVFEKRKEFFGNRGVEVLFAGKPGSGKTCGLGRTAQKNLKKYDDIILWRGDANCTWSIFENIDIPMILWLEDDVEYKLKNNGKKEYLEDHFEEVHRWSNYRKIANSLRHDVINVVQPVYFDASNFGHHLNFARSWKKIYKYLLRRNRMSDHISLFFDEFNNLSPETAQGKLYSIVYSLKGFQGEFRKNHISSFYACHRVTEVSYLLRAKIRWFLYMKGTKPHSESIIDFEGVKKLNVGAGILEGENFEIMNFKFIGDPIENLRADMSMKGGGGGES